MAHPGVYIRRYKEAVDRAAAALERVEKLERLDRANIVMLQGHVEEINALKAKLARCVEALNLVLPGLDDNWSQIPEGMAAIEAARAALAAGKGE